MSTHLVVGCSELLVASGVVVVVVVVVVKLHVESQLVVVDFPFFFTTHHC